jgi:hypothetical protein
MKALLGVLMCLVFTIAQTFAISGGPWGRQRIGVIGTYAGVLHALVSTDPSLGLFSLRVKETGLGTGDFVVFTGARTFVGTITGVADPDTTMIDATLQGIPVVTGGGQTVTTLNLHADGTLKAKAKATSGSSASSGIRLRGAPPKLGAHVVTTDNNASPPTSTSTDYRVSGFKQSESTQ